MEIIKQPWPWYVAGPIIGLIVPALLILGNKHFGISGNFRHACAACFPAGISYFKYEWKKEIWNFFFVGGILVGAIVAVTILDNPAPIIINPRLKAELADYGINDFSSMVPKQLFTFESLFTLRGMIMLVFGGFLVGFGSRYAGGCTSGHSITGLSDLQFPSLVATICFMIGGYIMANLFMPYILSL